MNTPRMTQKAAQADAIGRRLLSGEPVNQVAAGDMGIWRLSGVIYRLRRRGWPITTERDHNNGLAHYSVPRGWKPNEHRL